MRGSRKVGDPGIPAGLEKRAGCPRAASMIRAAQRRGAGPGGAGQGSRAVTGGRPEKGLNGRSDPRQGQRTGESLGEASVAAGRRELGGGSERWEPFPALPIASRLHRHTPHSQHPLPGASSLAHTNRSCRSSEAGPKGSERREGMQEMRSVAETGGWRREARGRRGGAWPDSPVLVGCAAQGCPEPWRRVLVSSPKMCLTANRQTALFVQPDQGLGPKFLCVINKRPQSIFTSVLVPGGWI